MEYGVSLSNFDMSKCVCCLEENRNRIGRFFLLGASSRKCSEYRYVAQSANDVDLSN